jgi:dipeptidyl aminopeptidase/acylaminoacyl peptidase
MRVCSSNVRGAICAGVLTLTGLRVADAAPLIPLEQFAAGSEMAAPSLSPDGTKLTYLSTVAGERYVVVRELQKGAQPRPVLRATTGTYEAVACNFKTNTRLLCRFHGIEHDFGPYPASRLIVMDSDGSHLKVLFESRPGSASPIQGTQFQGRILDWLPDDAEHVLIEMADADSYFPAVYSLNVDSGALHAVVGSREPVLDWLADRDGVVRFGSGYRTDEGVQLARNSAKDPWRTLEKYKRFEGARFTPLAFGPLPNQLFVLAPHQGRQAIWQMDLEENSDYQLVFSRPDVDVDEIVTWPNDGHVVGFGYNTDQPHIEFIDPDAAAINQMMDKNVPNTFHEVVDVSRDGHLVLIHSSSDVEPGVYHLFDTNKHELTTIGRVNTALSQASLAPTRAIVVPGPDGISIHGYLTLPLNTPPGKAIAAVVFPHGGPYARDEWGYDDLVQLMANRGYAVLQLNFRGSTGYGEAWRRAGHQAWGTVMHDDITAGAHWLVKQGIADPGRMCIVGWSYGGYAALTAAVKDPHLYRCAVSIAGVSDMSQLANDEDRFYGGYQAARESTGTDKAQLAAQSPVLHADQIKIPVLLVHGDQDSTVALAQSEAMAKALKSHGVPSELVVIKGGDHQLPRPAMKIILYTKLEAFLAANLGAQ